MDFCGLSIFLIYYNIDSLSLRASFYSLKVIGKEKAPPTTFSTFLGEFVIVGVITLDSFIEEKPKFMF